MKRAQNVTEVVLLASIIAVISLVVLAKFNNIKFDLAALSKIKENFMAGIDAKTLQGQNIENCIKINGNSAKCKVYKDSYGSPYVIVETTGTSGSTKSIVYLSTETKDSTEGCVGMLLAGLAKSCYDSEGNEVECDFDVNGEIKSIKIKSKNGSEDNYSVDGYILTDASGATQDFSDTIDFLLKKPGLIEPPSDITPIDEERSKEPEQKCTKFIGVCKSGTQTGSTTTTTTNGGSAGGGGMRKDEESTKIETMKDLF